MKIPSRTGVTAGVTPSPQSDGQPRGRRRAIVAGLVATGLVGSSLILPGFAAAAVPTAPDNIVVFPNRDMVVLEGFDALAGKDVTIEVYEDGGNVLKGATTGRPVAGAEFEVNHPGGLCWGVGAAANLRVTPNIDRNDRVSIKVDGAEVADTIVQDVEVNGSAGGTGGTITVANNIGPNVNRAQLESRIINPDLDDTAVARRDLRALPGPLLLDRNGVYQSGLDVGTGVATYEFTDNAIAEQARGGGGERIMAWQAEDVDGNRQGLTIAEAGEPGGPGMGGCPAGPGDVGNPSAGSAAAIRSTDRASIQVNWTAAAQVPGAPAISGYSVVALGPDAPTGQVQIGRRTGATATSATITGLDPAVAAYTVEVRSLAGTRLSEPFVVTPGQAGGGGGTPGGDGSPPNATISAAAPVTFTGLAADESVYYTLDRSPAFVADMPASNALLYKDPIAITTAGTVVNWAAFDPAGNRQDGSATFGPATNQTPGAPTATATPGAEFATVNWTVPTQTGASPITKYVITATPPTGAPVVVEAGATLRTFQVRPLAANTAYAITVAAANTQGTGAASTPVTVTPTVNNVPRVTIGTSRWKAGDFRVTGTTSAPVGALIQVRRTSATGQIIAQGNAVAGAAAGSQDYSIRARNGAAPAANPNQIWVTVTVNGVTGTAGPFAVAAG